MNRTLTAVLDELREKLSTLYGDRLERIILYGSHARGDAEPFSDIDCLVVLKSPVSQCDEIHRTGGIVMDLSLKYDQVICCLFMDQDRFLHRNGPLLRNVRKEGITI